MAVRAVPCNLFDIIAAAIYAIARLVATASGIFPFGLGGQAIFYTGESGVLLAEECGILPRNIFDRAVVGIFLEV